LQYEQQTIAFKYQPLGPSQLQSSDQLTVIQS